MIRPVVVAAGNVELLLGPAQKARAGAVFVAGVLLPEEVAGHVFDGIKAETIAFGLIDHPANAPDEHAVDVLVDNITHVVKPVIIAPRGGQGGGVGTGGIDALVIERFAGFTRVVLAVGIEVRIIKFSIAPARAGTGAVVGDEFRGGIQRGFGHGDGRVQIAGVLVNFLVGKGMDGEARGVGGDGEVIVRIKFRATGMPLPRPFGVIGIFRCPKGIEAGVGALLRDVPGKGIAVEHLPLVVVINRIRSLAPAAIRFAHEMEILRHKSRNAWKERARINRIQRPGIVGHDVVEIHPQPESMRHFHQREQLCLGAVARSHRAALILVPEVETIIGVVPHRVSSGASLARWWQPERGVAGFGYFRQAILNFTP